MRRATCCFAKAAKENKWNLNFGGIALMWRGGCIIRSQFLSKIKDAYDKNPGLTNLLLDEFFSSTLLNYQASWRRGIIAAIQAGCRLRRSRLPSHSSMDSALRVCRESSAGPARLLRRTHLRAYRQTARRILP